VSERSAEVEALIARGSYDLAAQLEEAEQGQAAIDAAARLEALRERANGIQVEDEDAKSDAAMVLLAEEPLYLESAAKFYAALATLVVAAEEGREARSRYERAWSRSHKLNGSECRTKISEMHIDRHAALAAVVAKV
jgi:hypothetical protein